MRRFSTCLFITAILASAGATAFAQTVLSGDHSVDGHLCAGTGCTGTETFTSEVKIKSENPGLLFEDSTAVPGGIDADWRLIANNDSPAEQYFAIEDVDGDGEVFRIAHFAPQNSIYVADSSGNIGFGTSMPQTALEVFRYLDPDIALTDGTGHSFSFALVGGTMAIADRVNNTYPIIVEPGLDTYGALTIRGNGRLGLGTTNPDAALHLERSDGSTQFLIEEHAAVPGPRTLLNLQNNGRPEIVLGNSSTGGEWSFGAGTNFVLKQGAVGTPSSAKTKHLTVYASGDMEISGQLVTGGPTCGTGCDAVFSDDYDLPSVEQHAKAMFALGHLPNVGPTLPGQPVNMSEQYGNLLNELEHAHIFIATQNRQIAALSAELAAVKSARADDMAALAARLDALEGN